jgi:hypothetical protein
MLEGLLARCTAEPWIAQAWLTGSRRTPSDGAHTYETTEIALVLDPPSVHEDESDEAAMLDLIANLHASTGARRSSYVFVSETLIRAHSEHAVLLYSRA